MKTRRTTCTRSGERTFSKNWANERNWEANLEEYESDVLDQRLSHFQLSIQKFSKFVLTMNLRKIKD